MSGTEISIHVDFHCNVVGRRCTRCGYVFSPHDVLPILRRCPKGSDPAPDPEKKRPSTEQLECIYRGLAIEATPCEGCASGARIKVWSCGLKGKCTIERNGVGVADVCACCSEIKAPADACEAHP